MKFSITLMATLFSFSAFALVESKNCPEQFVISYHKIARADLSPEIEDSWSVKAGWLTVGKELKMKEIYKISTRSNTALCVYINGKTAAFLQTNNGVDELMIPYNHNVYFRTKLNHFSRNSISIAEDQDSLSLLAPVIMPDSDGGMNVLGEVKVGSAEFAEASLQE